MEKKDQLETELQEQMADYLVQNLGADENPSHENNGTFDEESASQYMSSGYDTISSQDDEEKVIDHNKLVYADVLKAQEKIRDD